MLDLIDRFAREPMNSDGFHIFLTKLLKTQYHHIVIHSGKLTPIVVWDWGSRCRDPAAKRCVLTYRLHGWLRCDLAHWVRCLLRLHAWRQQVSIYQRFHRVETFLICVLANWFASIFSQVKLMGQSIRVRLVGLLLMFIVIRSSFDLRYNKWSVF